MIPELLQIFDCETATFVLDLKSLCLIDIFGLLLCPGVT
ncbi:hypothetical protein Nos7107_5336 [Nostoc sp. PCC 7107]|nr:hypothetical protein Nos7107_5336 [Nostoc sp. PCC 7107]